MIAQISLGHDDLVEEGDEFQVSRLISNLDQVNGETTCMKEDLLFTLEVTDQINKNYSWTRVEKDSNSTTTTLKTGYIVSKSH